MSLSDKSIVVLCAATSLFMVTSAALNPTITSVTAAAVTMMLSMANFFAQLTIVVMERGR